MGKKSNTKKDFSTLLKITAFLLIALILCLALCSCKKKAGNTLLDHTELSQKVEDLQKNAAWAYEIEGDRLSKKINSFEAIAKEVPLSPTAFIALEGGAQFAPVFPELLGFTRLDTSNIQGEVLDLVTNFCSALCEYTSVTVAGNSSRQQEAGAETEAATNEEPPPQKDSSKIDAFFSPQTLYSLVLFLADSNDAGELRSFIIGAPFIGEDTIEVPVRFTCKDKMLYTFIYPVLQGTAWKIHQIEIYKVEENNGKTDRH